MVPVSRDETAWRKSSRSPYGRNCVEIRQQPGAVEVRDSKDTAGPVLRFSAEVWMDFVESLRRGEFDGAG